MALRVSVHDVELDLLCETLRYPQLLEHHGGRIRFRRMHWRNYLNLVPKPLPEVLFQSGYLQLGISKPVSDVFQVPLHNQLDVFRRLFHSRRPLKFFLMLVVQVVKFLNFVVNEKTEISV